MLEAFQGILLPYQKAWLQDQSRYKIALKSRQIGWTLFCGTLEATLYALQGEPNYYLSAGERQSRAAIEDVRKHAEAFKVAAEAIEDTVIINDREWRTIEVRLPGGGKVVGLPANPATVRGLRGNMFFDEMAFHKDGQGIWRAAAPIASHGWKVRVFSTPNGKQGIYYRLWAHGGDIWSRHEVDIYKAVAAGLPLDVEELRAAIGNDDDWAQEHLCAFLDAALAWISFDLLDAADDATASLELPEDYAPEGRLYLGVDIGRKRDLTVLYLKEVVGDVRWTRAVQVLEHMPFADQAARIDAWMPMVHRCCIDATGIGAQLAEERVARWGSKVEPVVFTGAVKEDMATSLRRSYEDRRERIPYDLELRRDLHSVKRTVTSAGNFRFDADRSDAGHADRFWASALAEHAIGATAQPFTYETIERMTAAGLLGGGGGGRRRRGNVAPGRPPAEFDFRRGGVW